MRVLLDECLPKKLKRYLPEHKVLTVPEMSWAGVKNGALLNLAQAEFDAFLTVDQHIESQQNMVKFDIAIVTLIAYSNEIDALIPFMPAVEERLGDVKAGRVYHVDARM